MQQDSGFFQVKKTINCGGRLIDLSGGKVMGILNVTPDSFFDGGRHNRLDAQLKQAEKMLAEGADFIDVGGYSTRPGAEDVSIDEELQRVIPAIKMLKKEFPQAIISIDTFRAKVAKEAINAGAHIINDISGGEDDPEMYETVANLQVPYIIMHKQGTPKTMQLNPQYEDVVSEVLKFFSIRLQQLHALGVNDVIIDPGFAFGKTLEHNYQLLNKLYLFRMLEAPMLVGVSRKSMINKILKTKPEDALNGTTVVHTIALMQGCEILRVHDVKQAVEAMKIVNYYRENN